MKRFYSSVFAVAACALSVSVSAQSTPATGGVSQPTFGASKSVTITGCLERAKSGASAGAVSDMNTFTLKSITSDTPGATGTTGTSGTANAPVASSYRLDGEDSKLSPHVGHKVEITGTVEDRPMGVTDTPAASTSSPEAPTLKVSSVKMIAASCSV